MYEGGEEQNKRPGIEESYESATGSSNLRVEADRRTAADLILAAGMSGQPMGAALMRLASEWDHSSRPLEPTKEAIAALAASIEVLPSGDHAGKVPVDEGGRMIYLSRDEAARRLALRWFLHEQKLLMQGLKTLPWVREQLREWAQEAFGLQDGQHVVAAVLMWWLQPKCLACGGRGLRAIAGTGRLSSKACGECRGSGETTVPYGGMGRRLLGYMMDCRRATGDDIQAKIRPRSKPRADQQQGGG